MVKTININLRRMFSITCKFAAIVLTVFDLNKHTYLNSVSIAIAIYVNLTCYPH